MKRLDRSMLGGDAELTGITALGRAVARKPKDMLFTGSSARDGGVAIAATADPAGDEHHEAI